MNQTFGTLTDLHCVSGVLRMVASVAGATVASFALPVLPYGYLCSGVVLADFLSALLLAKRLRSRRTQKSVIRFSSRRFRSMLVTLAKVYAFLLLAHGVDVVIVGDDASFSMLRFSAALVCFWQFWSILENEASANDAAWAKIAQRILVDKTERHLGIDLSELKSNDSPQSE